MASAELDVTDLGAEPGGAVYGDGLRRAADAARDLDAMTWLSVSGVRVAAIVPVSLSGIEAAYREIFGTACDGEQG